MNKFGWLTTICLVLMFCLVGISSSHAQTFTTLVTFNITDGAFPYSALVQGRDGNLYGTTDSGGITSCQPPYGCGTVFKVTPAGTLTTLHKFCSLSNCADGTNPEGALVLGTDGNFYGTTDAGGAHSSGTIFKITARGALTTLYSFCAETNCADGSSPRSSLILGSDGNFYGTTRMGGVNAYCTGCGTIFKITPGGQFATLHSFEIGDGTYPSSVIQGIDGNFYGTTYGQADFDCESTTCGTVFKMTPKGTLTTLHIFNFTGGSNPYGPLVESTKGNFSGTTVYGGTVLDVCSIGCGTIFKITSSGKLTTLQYLNWSDGAEPFAGLVWATDGNYYGTTEGGGGMGTTYEVGSGRGVIDLPFNNDGIFPVAGLLQSTNGTFYGSTSGDGVTSNGTIFSESNGLGPFIAFVQPTGKVGKAAQILSQRLTGATSVTFNGVPATSFKIVSDTYLTAVVPSGATTGKVVVTTPSGTLTSNVNFRITK
jgi:uncharacterized repeat protein (TIGR03803 family)